MNELALPSVLIVPALALAILLRPLDRALAELCEEARRGRAWTVIIASGLVLASLCGAALGYQQSSGEVRSIAAGLQGEVAGCLVAVAVTQGVVLAFTARVRPP